MAHLLIIEAVNEYTSSSKDGEILIHPWDIENLSQKLPVVTNEDYKHALDVIIKYHCDQKISGALIDIEKYDKAIKEEKQDGHI